MPLPTFVRAKLFSKNDATAKHALAMVTERLYWVVPDELAELAGAVCVTQGIEDGSLWLYQCGIPYHLPIYVCAVLGSRIIRRILKARQAA